MFSFECTERNETVNKFSLAGDKEKQLKQPGFTHSDCGPNT